MLLIFRARGFGGLSRQSVTPLLIARAYTAGPPRDPIDFNNNFHIERSTKKLNLESFNAHILDSRVVFDEESHSYFYNGTKVKQSVTSFVESHFEAFDPETAVSKMMSGKNWPNEKYKNLNGQMMSREEIIAKWKSISTYSKNRGTWIHYNIERHFNDMEMSTRFKELQQFLSFEEKYLKKQNIVPVRTEWRVVGPEENIAGTVDFVGRKPDGTYVIIDWKTTHDLGSKFDNGYGKMAKEPINNIPDCDGMKYSLQLNIYRYILQKYYGIKVTSMVIAAFASKASTYFMTSVSIMDNEIDVLFPNVNKQPIPLPLYSYPESVSRAPVSDGDLEEDNEHDDVHDEDDLGDEDHEDPEEEEVEEEQEAKR